MKKIEELLFERKLKAEQVAKKNLQYALSFPKFNENYKIEKQLIIQKAKDLANGKNFDNNSLLKQQKIVDNILTEIKLTRADLTPKYFCEKCQDSGIFENKTCDCVKKLSQEIIMTENNFKIYKTFEESNFSLFDNQFIETFYNKLQEWANKTIINKPFLALFGNTGTGKTFLMECLASEFLKNDKYVIFKSSYDVIKDCLSFHTSFDKNNNAILNKYFDCDVLLIDDLGSEPIYKNISLEYLYQILNKRERENKITIISTNLNLQQLREVYGERLLSRIVNAEKSKVFTFENADLRLKNKNK